MSPTVNNSLFINNSCIVTVAGDAAQGGAVAVGANSSLTISGQRCKSVAQQQLLAQHCAALHKPNRTMRVVTVVIQ
jgi:hypothetical protein